MRDKPLARLWWGHLASGFALSGDLSPTAAILFARHSVDLLAQLLEEAHCDHPTPSDAGHAAIFLSARHVIALKFGNPSLMPVQIAQDLNVSTRTLHGFCRQRRDGHAALIRRARASGCKTPDRAGGGSPVSY